MCLDFKYENAYNFHFREKPHFILCNRFYIASIYIYIARFGFHLCTIHPSRPPIHLSNQPVIHLCIAWKFSPINILQHLMQTHRPHHFDALQHSIGLFFKKTVCKALVLSCYFSKTISWSTIIWQRDKGNFLNDNIRKLWGNLLLYIVLKTCLRNIMIIITTVIIPIDINFSQ